MSKIFFLKKKAKKAEVTINTTINSSNLCQQPTNHNLLIGIILHKCEQISPSLGWHFLSSHRLGRTLS
jgi:hypothetical protein